MPNIKRNLSTSDFSSKFQNRICQNLLYKSSRKIRHLWKLHCYLQFIKDMITVFCELTRVEFFQHVIFFQIHQYNFDKVMIIQDSLIEIDYYISMSSVRQKQFQKLKRVQDDNSDSQLSSQSIQRIKKQLQPGMIQQGSITSSMSEFQKQYTSTSRCNNLDYFELKNLVFQLRSQVNNLHIDNQTLSNRLSVQANERQTLTKENQFLQQEIRKIKIAYQQSQRQLQVLRKKFRGEDDLDLKPFSMPSNMNNSRAKDNSVQKFSLQQSMQNLLTENQRLSKIVNDFENQNQKLSEQLKTLHEKNLQLTTTIHTKKNMQIEQLIMKNQELIQNLRQQIKKITTEKEEQKLQLKFMMACNEQLEQKIQYYRRQLANKNNKLDWQTTKQQKDSTYDRASLSDLKNKQMQLFELSLQNSKKQNLLSSIQQKLAIKEKQLLQEIQSKSQMKIKNQMLQKQYKQLQDVYFKQERQLTNLIVNKDHSSNKNQMEMKSLKASLQLLAEQKKYEVSERDATISKLQQKVSMLQFSNVNESAVRKIEYLKKQVALFEKENHNLKNQIQALKQQTNKPLNLLKQENQKLKIQKKKLQENLKKFLENSNIKVTENSQVIKKLKLSENEASVTKQKLKLQMRANDDIIAQLHEKSSKVQKQAQKIKELQKKLIKQIQLTSQINKNNRQLQNKLDTITASYQKLEKKYKKDINELDQRMNQVLTENQKKSSISKSRDDSKSYSQKSYKKSMIHSQPNQNFRAKQDSWCNQSIKSKYSSVDPAFNPNQGFNFSRKNQTNERVIKAGENKVNSQLAIHQNEFYNSDKKSYFTVIEKDSSNNKSLPVCKNDRLKLLLENVEKQLKVSENEGKKELMNHFTSQNKYQHHPSYDTNMQSSFPLGRNLFVNIKSQKDHQPDIKDYQSIIKKYAMNPSSIAENQEKQTDLLLNQYNTIGYFGHNRKVSEGLCLDNSNSAKGKNSSWAVSRKVTTQRFNVQQPSRKKRTNEVPTVIQQHEGMENNPSKQTFGRLKSQQSNDGIDQAILKMRQRNEQLRKSNKNHHFFISNTKKSELQSQITRNNIVTFRNQGQSIQNISRENSYEKNHYGYEPIQENNRKFLNINYK